MTGSRRKLRALSFVVVCLLWALSASAIPGAAGAAGNAATEHSACTTISSPGLHVLTSDVTDSGTARCIEITASNVTFDGNGHAIDGVDGDTGSRAVYVGTNAPLTNVTIRNVTVTNWETGVYYDDASNGTIRNVTASNSVLAGFNLYHSRDNALRNVTVTGGDDVGIYFASQATDNVVTNSTVVDNDGAAVFMDSWSGDVPTNRFENLTIGNSTAPNTTLSFTGRAVVIDQVSSPPADPPGWVSASRYLNVTGIVESSYLNLTLDYDDGDVAGDESSLAFSTSDDAGWNDIGGSSVDAAANELSVNFTSVPVSSSYPVRNWSVLGAFVGGGGLVTDCRVIDSPGSYSLPNDLSSTDAADCIEITASDVTIDGRGHTVDAGPGGKGIYAHGPLSNVTVRNLTVVNGGQGVHVGAGTDGTVVRNVTVRNAGGRAVVLRGSNATVTDSVVENPGTRGVLGTENGDGAVVSDTVIRKAGTKGMRLQRETTVRNVTVANAAEEGINLEVGATLTVLNSTITGSGSHGIWSEPGTLTVRNSTIDGSAGAGIFVEKSGSAPTVVDGTTVTNSTGAGVHVGPDVSDSELTGLTLAGNAGEDLRVDGVATGTNVDLNGSAIASFSADSTSLSALSSNPSMPASTSVQGPVLDVDAAGGSLDLTLPYAEPSGAESAVSAWRLEGDWTRLDGSRDAAANTVTVTGVSTHGTVAVLHNAGPYFEPTVDSASSPVRAGTSATVDVTVENAGANAGTETVTLTANGSVVDSREVSLAAGATETVTLAWDTTGVPSGDYQVTVNAGFESASSAVTVWSTNVASCGELFVPATYRLTANLTSSDGGDCIEITASNVTLDGMGHTVDAGPGGVGVHLDGPASNVTVRNLTVENGDRGVNVSEAAGTTLADVVVRNANGDGVHLDSDTTLANVRILGSGGDGIQVERASEAPLVVRNSTVNGSAGRGIFVDESASQLRIVGTVVGDNDDAGARLHLDSAEDVVVEDSVFAGNGQVGGASGIRVEAADNATFRNTTVLDSGAHGFDVNTWILDELSVVFRDNTARGNAGDGFFVRSHTNNVSFAGDAVSGNGGVGFDLNSPANATNVDLNGTTVSFVADNDGFDSSGASLSPTGLEPTPPGTATVQGPFVNTTVSDGTLDLTLPYTEPSGFERSVATWRYDGDWTSLQVNTTHDTAADTVTTTAVAANGTFGVLFKASPYLEPTVDDAPAVVQRGESYAVNATVASLAGIGDTQTVNLTIDGSVVDSQAVDLAAGESRSLTLSWSTPGVSVGQRTVAVVTGNASAETTVAVRSDEVIECRVLDRAGTYRLTRNLSSGGSGSCLRITASDVVVNGAGHVIDPGSDGNGVAFEDLTNVTVRNVTIAGGDYGVTVRDGAGTVTVENVTVKNAQIDAIGLDGPNATVTDAVIENPGSNGVRVGQDGGSAVVSDTVVRDPGFAGIRFAADATVANVTVESAGTDGLELLSGPSVTVRNSTVAGSAERGIAVVSGSLTLRNSTVTGSGERGVVAMGGTVTVADSAINDSDGNGLYVLDVPSVHVENSVLGGNGQEANESGVRVDGAPATLENVTVANSGASGFRVDRGSDEPVVLEDTVARNNTDHGFRVGLYASTNVTFHGDSASNNGGHGFYVQREATGTNVSLNGTTVAAFHAKAVALSAVATTPAPPANATGVGPFVNATAIGGAPSLDLTLSYAGTGDPEEWVSVWRYDGGWAKLDTGRDAAADAVTATNVSSSATLAPLSAQPDRFLAPSVDVATDSVERGRTLTVTAGVDNVGRESATRTVTLTVDGRVVDSRAVTLAPGSSTDVTFEWATASAAAGEYAATVGTDDATASAAVTVRPDATPPTADVGPDATVDAGTEITLDGSNSTDNVGIDTYEWNLGDGTTATGETVTHTYAGAGTYTATLTVTDAAGNADVDTATIEVESSDGGGAGGSGGGGGAGTGGAGAGDGGSSDERDSNGEGESSADGRDEDGGDAGSDGTDGTVTRVTAESDASGGATATASVDAGETARIDFGDSVRDAGGGVAVRQVAITLDEGESVSGVLTFEARPISDPPADVRAARGDDGGLSYFELTASMDGADASDRIETATVRFTVDQASLADRGLDGEDVALHRYDGATDTWEQLDTSVVTESDGETVYQATTGEFSVFAVAERGALEAVATDGADADPSTETETPDGSTVTTGTSAADNVDSSITATPGASGPGFGPLAAALALVLGTLMARRRSPP